MWKEEDIRFNIDEVRLVRSPREHPLYFLRVGRHDCVWLPPLVNCIGKYDFQNTAPEPDVEEVEETMRMSWKNSTFFDAMDPLSHYSTWLRQIDWAMNDVTTAHTIPAMRLSERNILKPEANSACNGRRHSEHTVEITRQCYNTLCNQLGKIK